MILTNGFVVLLFFILEVDKLKKLISFILSFSMIFSFAVTAIAIGDTNVDGGGGDMGGGTGTNKWNVGDDGVRITVVSAKSQNPVKTPVDFTNIFLYTSPAHCPLFKNMV